MLSLQDRERLARELPPLKHRYSKLLMPDGMAQAWIRPPASPQECLFAKMSANYSADLKTRVEPCVFGGKPDCSQCGCSISSALHWIKGMPVAGPLKIDHLVRASVAIGSRVARFSAGSTNPRRWAPQPELVAEPPLAQIDT